MGVKISSLTTKAPLDGTEQIEINDAGTTKKTTTQDIADLGGGGAGGTWGSITGTLSDQTDLNSALSGKQSALGFTPENVANKATDFLTIDNTKYPTTQAVNNEIIARLAGLAWKAPVTCATTASITLSGEQTIDGVATSSSRVLVKNQSTASQNGIYVSSAGGWNRATDADTGTDLQNAVVPVAQGTSNGDTTWNQTADGITIGVTAIVWGPFGTSAPDASTTVKGIAKLYTATGTNTDGAMDQNSATTAIGLKVAKAGDTMGGNLAMGANKVTGLGAASANGDAVRYEQVTPAVQALITQVITNGVTTTAPSEDAVFDALATKQATLVSGTNIKTLNGGTLLGSGDISINSVGGTLYLYNNFI